MEILDSLGINWKILLGQIINFLVILFLLKRFAYKPFLEIMKQRKDKIEQGIKNSEQAEKTIQTVKSQREKILKNAQENALQLFKQNEEKGKQKAEQVFEQAGQEKQAILLSAKEQGAKEIAMMKQSQTKELLGLSVGLAEKILKQKIDKEKDKEIIQGFLSKL